MLNKKTLFNTVYSIALFGAITSCIGILNELLNLIQLYNKGISSLIGQYSWESLSIPFVYHLVAFILCTFTVIMIILHVTNILKEKHDRILNACIITTCVIIFALSLTFIYQLQYEAEYSKRYMLSTFDYTTLYTFRSVVMSYIASVGTILFCNIIECRSKKKGLQAPTDEEAQE